MDETRNLNSWVIFKKKLQTLKSNLRVRKFITRTQMSNKRKELLENVEALDIILMNDDGSASDRE